MQGHTVGVATSNGCVSDFDHCVIQHLDPSIEDCFTRSVVTILLAAQDQTSFSRRQENSRVEDVSLEKSFLGRFLEGQFRWKGEKSMS